MSNPFVAYIAGSPRRRAARWGMPGANMSGSQGTAQGKIDAPRQAGAQLAQNPTPAGELMAKLVSTLPV